MSKNCFFLTRERKSKTIKRSVIGFVKPLLILPTLLSGGAVNIGAIPGIVKSARINFFGGRARAEFALEKPPSTPVVGDSGQVLEASKPVLTTRRAGTEISPGIDGAAVARVSLAHNSGRDSR